MNDLSHDSSKKKRRIGIKWKMFFILLCFVSVFAIVMWIFQIQMLHFFYQGAKFNELRNTAEEIAKSIDENNTIPNITEEYAKERDNDIWIYKTVNKRFDVDGRILYSDGTGDSIGYHIESDFQHLYETALNNDGNYIAMIPMNNPRYSYFDFKIVEDNQGKPNEFPFVTGNIKKLNAIFVNVVSADNENYVIIQRTNITPLGAMVDMLENQLLITGLALLVFTLILAAIMARLITRPIEQINRSAKSLAIGTYDIEFSGRGYREIDELSDTLNYAARELSKNDRLNKELISNVSHDLRTPLTMIKGYSEVIRDIPGENTPENVQVIIDETERLTGLVNDMLDLSKLKSGSRVPDMQEFCLTEMVRNTMMRYEKLVRQGGYNIEFDAENDIYVIADATMVLQVIYNLINNAINYCGDDKAIFVKQTVSGDTVRISVTDNGEGISQDDIPFIWDRYYKVDKVHRRAAVGTGLGLSIVKGILEVHNATYGVTSSLGNGSTFWFELKTSDSAEYSAEIVEI